MTQPDHRSVERAVREERVAVVASLTRRFGDLALAEDATQEALEAAARRWPIDGTPDRPGAWLMTTAYRKAIGILRKHRPDRVESTDAWAPASTGRPWPGRLLADTGGDATDDPALDVAELADPALDRDVAGDVFGLLLLCCHPALHSDARVALTLRHVCGLTVREIAAAHVVDEATVAKRLVRARRKIVDAGIAFDPVGRTDLPDRLDDVRTVISLVFTEGHLASGTGPAIRTDLCDEAIWLGRQLHRLAPDDGESTGLLALMLLDDARRAARIDDAGALVPLPRQARSSWDETAIREARELLATTGRSPLGPFQLQAAIALLHMSGDEPDWARIADLYGALSRLDPSPVVEVNRALAVGRADGPPAGLAVLQPVLDGGRLDRYAPLHAVHADLLEGVGDTEAASAAWRRGAAHAENPAQRTAMLERAGDSMPDRRGRPSP